MQENMAKTISKSLFSLCILFHFFLGKCMAHHPRLAPAFYIFGDSLLDNGNNNNFHTSAKVPFKPYGIDFPNGPTGRFTNGKTSVDFMAEFLGLPLVPSYNGLSAAQRAKTLTGMNYASGSAGILRESGSALGRNVPLVVQIDSFKETIDHYLAPNFKNKDKLSHHLCRSIFAVSIGGNDYINNYLKPENYNSSRLYDPERFAALLVKELTQILQKLYHLGARKFLVYNLSPIGCIPAMIQERKIQQGCADDLNDMASSYNKGFSGMLQELRCLPGSTFVEGDMKSSFFLDHRPVKDGILKASPCCLTNNVTHQCLENTPPCTDRDRHLFWDGIHPTQAVNKLLAISCFYGPVTCIPINLLGLAMKP